MYTLYYFNNDSLSGQWCDMIIYLHIDLLKVIIGKCVHLYKFGNQKQVLYRVYKFAVKKKKNVQMT